jgi:hypothetical protein
LISQGRPHAHALHMDMQNGVTCTANQNQIDKRESLFPSPHARGDNAKAADKRKIERGANFEIWLAKEMACEHSELIGHITGQQLLDLRRRYSAGQDISDDVSEIAVRIASKRRLA